MSISRLGFGFLLSDKRAKLLTRQDFIKSFEVSRYIDICWYLLTSVDILKSMPNFPTQVDKGDVDVPMAEVQSEMLEAPTAWRQPDWQ